MIVAIKAATMRMMLIRSRPCSDLTEFEYLALFLWLAIAGAGAVSLDHLLMKVKPRPAQA